MASYGAALEAFRETLEGLDLPKDSFADPEAQARLGRRAALLATSELTWDDHLGPLYAWSDVATLLGTVGTRQGINDLAKRRRLLGLPTKAGRILYPAFQFRGARTIAGLHELLIELDSSDASQWTKASWFVTPQDELGGESPVAYLSSHPMDERVLTAARRVAARLAA
jgi:hypothetical protein